MSSGRPTSSPDSIILLALLITHLKSRIANLSQELEDQDNWEAAPAPYQRALQAKNDVLKISHKIKTSVDPLTTSKTAFIHLDNDDADLSGIKITQFMAQRMPADWQNMYVLTLIHKTGARDYYFIKDAELIKTIEDLHKLASEMNMVEYSLTKGMIKACEIRTFPPSYWSMGFWDEKNTHGLYYDQVNDPIVLEQFVSQVLPLQKQFKNGEPLVVIDMGGGKGRLAGKLIAEAVESDIPIRYVLVEPCALQVAIAKKNLEKYNANQTCHVEIVQSTLERFNSSEKAHCIISSGAGVNLDVVTRLQAIENIKALGNLLLPNGFLIATGQTAVLIKSKHFNAADLKVLSYAVLCPTPKGYENHPFLEMSKLKAGFFGHYQRYVCQKMAAEEKLVPGVTY